MTAISPCLWMNDEAERAATFYAKTFPGGRILATSRYPESGDNPSKMPPGSVLAVELEIAGLRFTALNGGPIFTKNASVSFFVFVERAADADRLYAAFADGGEALMPLGPYPWSERYGWVKDRFGVSWQIMATSSTAPGVVPCLMFSDAIQGRAEEAMKQYVEIFPDARIESVARYLAGEGAEGEVKHGRFVLGGQPFAAMDSPVAHGFTFNEGISFHVACDDQREIDRYWDALGAGGSPSMCGWLKDRFGLSWQVVPKEMPGWMASPDVAARGRAFAAMLTMKKLDAGALARAFAGA